MSSSEESDQDSSSSSIDDDAEALLRGVEAVDADAIKLATAELTAGDDDEGEGQEGEDDNDDEYDGPVVNIRVQNVVSTLSLNIKVDLDRIASTARNAEYNPRRYIIS